MKRLLTSITLVALFVAYAFLRRENAGGVTDLTPTTTPDNSVPTTATNSASTTSTPPTTTTPPASMPVMGQYKNGSYTGSVEDAYYGNVQVRAVISGGKISDVQFLQYPNDRETSRMINSQAMPMLTQQAIDLQGSNVDGVSGATDTSIAFRASLDNALGQAK